METLAQELRSDEHDFVPNPPHDKWCRKCGVLPHRGMSLRCHREHSVSRAAEQIAKLTAERDKLRRLHGEVTAERDGLAKVVALADKVHTALEAKRDEAREALKARKGYINRLEANNRRAGLTPDGERPADWLK